MLTKKLDKIYLKCNICDEAHIYSLNPHEIVALESEWRNHDSSLSLLTKKPDVGIISNVLLKSPLKLNLNKNFWSVFMNPNAQLNGIESENDIQSLRFCLCKPLGIINTDNSSAFIEIMVIKYVDLEHQLKLNNPQIGWLTLLNEASNSKTYYNVENFKNHALININIESDLGLTVIVKKENGMSKIVAVNEWDFHRNLWYLYTGELTKEQEEKYGINY